MNVPPADEQRAVTPTAVENQGACPALREGNGAGSAPPTEIPGRTIRDRLGPVLVVSRLRRPVVGRLWATGIALACGAVLGLAATLRPTATGVGTHTQLGLGTCGFLLQTGYPCPTCGMTTAYADLVHGRLLRSLLDQPAGFVLALATALTGVIALAAVISGRTVRVNWYRVNPVRVVWGFVVLFIGSWAFKILVGLAAGTLPAR